MADAASSRFTFILIHGAWQGAWAWETIVPRLNALGYDAIAVDLPGNGHNPMAPAEVNLERYAAHVAGIIDATQGPIVMVGHSMGGTAAARACELRPDRVALAIFLAAFLLPDGMSVLQFYELHLEAWMVGAHKRVTYDESGLLSSIDPVSAVEVFYHKADSAQAEAAARRLTPQPEGGRRSQLKLSPGGFGTVPRVYIEAREDRSVHLPLQRKMQAMSPCRAVYGLDSDHAPHLSDPDALVALFMTAVAEPQGEVNSMKPSLFDYQAPTTREDAISLLAGDTDAVVLAGGQTLLPAMNFRAANPSLLIDIQHIKGLRGIAVGPDAIVVKAMVRHREFELDANVQRANPLIAEVMQHVAHIPIRNRGTVVGSLCHADPSAEMPLLLVLLGGSVIARGPSGWREIAAEKFFQSFLTTARSHDEIVIEARFPLLPPKAGWAFDEVTRRHGDYAVVGIGCVLSLDDSGRATGVRLAACGIADRPVRLKDAETILNGTPLGVSDLDAAVAASVAAVTQPDDINVSQSYRRRALGTLIRRMVARAAQRAEAVA